MNNNQHCIAGFVKRAQQSGLSEAEALALLEKTADQMGGGQPPIQAGNMAGDPNQSVPQNLGVGGGDPSGQGGIPPELEQMISQLPPEVLAQLVQEIEAEMGGQGGDPNGGGQPAPHHHHQHQDPGQAPQGDPSQMMDPSQMKQGSARLIAKEAAYIDGFIGRAMEVGYDLNSARGMYKHALALIESSTPKTVSAKDKEKNAAHFAGFAERAAEYGISKQAAEKLFVQTFGNK